jgi:hypothetical protein
MDARHALDERYVRGRVLGGGSSSVVYLGRDRLQERDVAVKVLKQPASDASRRELAALNALRLPGVVHLVDDGVDADGRAFLVTDLVAGTAFPARANEWSALRPLVIEILRVLRSLHALGLVHRDLKPEHVLIDEAGRPTLLDLGLARGVALEPADAVALEVAGTLRYASPEQLVGGGRPDPRSDLYSLGVMIYEALTGTVPHEHVDPGELRRRRLAGEVDWPETLPAEARSLLERLLERRPKRRAQSAEEALQLVGAGASAECDAAFAHWASVPDPATLHRLFHGPERLFHLRSDATELLWQRCGDDVGELSAELTAWIRHGLATWVEGALQIARPDLDRLQRGVRVRQPALAPDAPSPLPEPMEVILAAIHLGWPDTGVTAIAALTQLPAEEVTKHCRALERMGWVRAFEDRYQVRQLPAQLLEWDAPERAHIHAALADGLAEGEPRKLFHLQAAGRWFEAAQVALLQGKQAMERGDLAAARTALDQGLRAARWASDGEGEGGLLEALGAVTLAEESVRGFELMLYALGRSRTPAANLERLIRAGRAAQGGALSEASAQLDGVEPFEAEDLDRWRWGVFVRITLRQGVFGDDVLARAREWAHERGTQTAWADVWNWEGLLAYKRGEVAEAARLHAQAAEGKRHGTGRLSARGNQLAALLEVPDLLGAIEAAERLRQEAAALRSPLYEGYAEWLARTARYRTGAPMRPDWELIDAARQLEVGVLQGQLLFQEAVHAWRAGDLPAAHGLATESARFWAGDGRQALRALPGALALACSPRFDAARAEVLAKPSREAECGLPGIWLQLLGVLSWRSEVFRARWRPRMGELAEGLPASLRTGRRELMTIAEALDGIHTLPSPAMED